jgi:hypothetical protein
MADMDDSDIILIRDPYRIVSVKRDDSIMGYAILTAAGARLHFGLTLDDAKARLEDFIGNEIRKRELDPAAKGSQRRPR